MRDTDRVIESMLVLFNGKGEGLNPEVIQSNYPLGAFVIYLFMDFNWLFL